MNELGLLANNISTQGSSLVTGLDAYIHKINSLPMLSLQQEQQYAKSWHQDGNLEAAQKLVAAHLRYVVRIAKGYLGYGLQLADLIQEGSVGLMKAVKKFQPEKGVRLVSFAVYWIKAEIHDFIIKNWRIVKVATTKAQRKLFFNLRKNKARLGWFKKSEVAAVAADLGVKPEEVYLMEQRLTANDASFDLPTIDDDANTSPSSYLQSPNTNPLDLLASNEGKIDVSTLNQALISLDARSKDIIINRWLNDKKATLQEMATKHNVSAERIRQIEASALKALRAALA